MSQIKKRVTSIFAVIFALAIMLPTAMASNIFRGTPDVPSTYSWSATNGTEYHGEKAGDTWALNNDQKYTFWSSVANTSDRAVRCDLRHNHPIFPGWDVGLYINYTDKNSIKHWGTDGSGTTSEANATPFVADSTKNYFAVISTTHPSGATGQTSVRKLV